MVGIDDFDIEVSDDVSEYESLHLMNIEAVEQYGDSIVHLWCRTEDNERRHVEVVGHDHSFYIRESAYSNKVKNHHWVKRVEKGYTSIQGEDLIKVWSKLPEYVDGSYGSKGLNDYFDDSWEADVDYENRWLIDTGIKTHFKVDMSQTWDGNAVQGDYRVNVNDITPLKNPSWQATPRMNTVDIEVESPDGFPEPDEAKHPVTAITAHDNYTDDYTVWVLRHESWEQTDEEITNLIYNNLPNTISVNNEDLHVDVDDVRVFSNEGDMLHSYNEYIESQRPDLLGGWNSSANDMGGAFDYPYLINRCSNLNIMSTDKWSPLNQVWDSNWGPNGKGIEFHDMMKAYKKTRWSKPDGGYGLENISKLELGDESKLDIDDIDDAWESSPSQFIKYNIRDVQAVLGVDVSAEVTQLFQNLRKLTGAKWGDCHNNIDLLDHFILRFAHDMGVVLPTNTKPERGWFYGGHVFEPELGRHPNAVYPDVWSEYPNAFRTVNMSPETIIGTKEDLEASEYEEEDCRWSYIDTRPDSIKNPDDMDGAAPPEKEKCYYLKPSIKEGFMNKVVDHVMGLKDQYDGTDLYGPVKQVVNSCFTPDTEVLTPDGVKNITEVEVGDDVYSYNPETNDMEVKSVVETIERPEYDGELIHIQNQQMDLKVTPDHRFIVNRPRHMEEGEWEHTEAGDLNEWTHYETPSNWNAKDGEELFTFDVSEHIDNYEVFVALKEDVHGHTFVSEIDGDVQQAARGKVGYTIQSDVFEAERELVESLTEEIYIHKKGKNKWVPLTYYGDDVLELVAWYITEGSATQNGENKMVNISQYEDVNEENHLNIQSILERMNIHYGANENDISFTSDVWFDVLGSLCGVGSHNKTIPDMVFDSSEQQKKTFIETLLLGDGSTRGDKHRYTTASKTLRDDVMQLVWECGNTSSYTHGDGVWRVRWSEVRNKMSFRCHRDKSTETAENGVYCIQVEDNHTLVAGRNGKFSNIFNCWGVYGDSDSYGKGYRLFDWRVAESVTLYGREVIQYSAQKYVDSINELKDKYDYDGRNAYQCGGDTDSVMTSIPFMDAETRDDQQQIVDLAIEACEMVNDSYDEFAADAFNSDGEFIELEIESYAPWLFIPEGKTKKKAKKRYAEIIGWEEGEWFDPPEFRATGIDVVRSDRSTVTKEVVEDVLTYILRIDDPTEARQKTYERIKEIDETIRSGEKPPSYISRPKGMSKDPTKYGTSDRQPSSTYRGAKYANEHFEWENMTEGSKPQLLAIERVRGDWPRTYSAETAEDGCVVDAISMEQPDKLPDGFYIDYDTQIEKTVKDPLMPILAAMGWEYEEAFSASEETDIEAYF